MKELSVQKDLQLINSYLDQELEGKDILTFADHLAEDPELKNNMAEMLKVKTLLKSIPQEKPPRDYTLTRSMAREARKPGWLERLLPTFKTAAVLCSLALVFTFIMPYMKQNPQQTELVAKSFDISELSLAAETQKDDTLMVGSVTAELQTEEDSHAVLHSSSIRRPQSEIAKPAEITMPSYGVRGGTPKNEYLLTTQRIQPAEKDFDAAKNPEAEDNSADIAAEEETEDEVIKKDTVIKLLVQGILAAILFVSVLWIIRANRQQDKLKLQ